MKKKVIVIVGPTAVGKTELSMHIAKNIQGEIISGDSMQIYRGMDIGTAKIKSDEMQAIPHHMIDIKNPDEAYSVAQFQTDVRRHITEIHERGNIPILVGGSGLYIESTLYDFSFSDQERDHAYTERLEKMIEQDGIAPLYAQLEKVDPEQAAKIHPNNHRKVIRALEVYKTSGTTMSEQQKKDEKEPLFDSLYIGLEMNRQLLYERINSRVDQMVEAGLINEVKTLMDKGYHNEKSMQAIGYKEIIPFLGGEITEDEAVTLLKRNSRRFAKRQFTWFKNRLPVKWYPKDEDENPDMLNYMNEHIAGFLKN